ncbi:MAG: PKD domain-containing protein, partial [Thermoplasmata archaeon]|nr:PKD domain-containing protein [Thermoplasmata archaeon]
VVTTSPQEVEVGAIDITATVTDNFDATSTLQVWINVLYPDSTPLENVSMTYDAGDDEFDYSATSLVELGTYDFEIWVADGQQNWNSATGSFVIRDTTNPTADAGIDQNVDQGETVTFDGSGSSDNDPLFDTDANYTWTFNDLGARTIWGVGPTYTFTRGGDYDVTLTVTDRAGNQGTDVVTVHVVAGPSPPPTPRVTDPTETTLTISWEQPLTYTDGTALPGTDIKGYTIYRAASADGPYTELIFVTTLTHTDTGLVRNTTYYYKVTCWSLAENIESERTTWKSGLTTAVSPPPPEDGGEQDMMMWMLMLILIIVIVVIAIVAAAMFRKKKPVEEEYPEAYEEEYYYEDEDLPPPPPE